MWEGWSKFQTTVKKYSILSNFCSMCTVLYSISLSRNLSFLYFISPKGGPTFNVRRLYYIQLRHPIIRIIDKNFLNLGVVAQMLHPGIGDGKKNN